MRHACSWPQAALHHVSRLQGTFLKRVRSHLEPALFDVFFLLLLRPEQLFPLQQKTSPWRQIHRPAVSQLSCFQAEV